MRATASVASRGAVKMSPSAARRHILNCYDIVNASTLAWPVNLYSLRRLDGQPQSHSDRRELRTRFGSCESAWDVNGRTASSLTSMNRLSRPQRPGTCPLPSNATAIE